MAEAASQIAPARFYGRHGNPTRQQVEKLLAQLEGAEDALLTGSGMAAIHVALLSQLQTGDHVVAQTAHYAGTQSLLRDYLPRLGIEVTQVDQQDPSAFTAAFRPQTKLVLLETPSNPLLLLTDLQTIASAARERGILSICDGTFATPINQRPLELGVDAVVHSATKYLSGHHDVLAGAILGSHQFIEQCWKHLFITGPVLSPFDAWLLLRGLRTLELRVLRQNENAQALAELLASSPQVDAVHYPGLPSHPQHALAQAQMSHFGGMLSFSLRGGSHAVEHFLAELPQIPHAPSLGGVETLLVAPGKMWRHELNDADRNDSGIHEGLLRISAGIENTGDLLREFEHALRALPSSS